MSQKFAVAEAPIADAGPDSPFPRVFFAWFQTVLSQYANSPIILALIESWSEAIDPLARFDEFFDIVWNIDTAQGFGLDIWGRIVGVTRVLHVPVPGDNLGFQQQDGADTFDHGVWYGKGTLTQNYSLTDSAYRRLILAKAALNITNGSAPSINAIMMALFPDYGNSYVRDDGNMTLTYVFGEPISAVDRSIVTQSGVLPKPAGVSYSVETP